MCHSLFRGIHKALGLIQQIDLPILGNNLVDLTAGNAFYVKNRIFSQRVQRGNGVKFFHTLQNRPEQHQHPRHKEAVPADKLLQTVHLFLSSIAAPNFSLRIIQNRTHPGALPNAPWPGPGRKAARPRPCPGWDKIRLPPLGSEAAGHSLPPALLPPPPYPGSPSRPAAIPHPWTSRSGVLPQFEHHIAHGCRTRNARWLWPFSPLKTLDL